MTNGLKLADRAYVRELKKAGMQVCYLSFSGGFDDDLYDAIDEMRCAEKKRLAFENLRAEHVFTSIGMILVPGLNESAITATWKAIDAIAQRARAASARRRSDGTAHDHAAREARSDDGRVLRSRRRDAGVDRTADAERTTRRSSSSAACTCR